MEQETKKKPNAQKWTLERVSGHLDKIELAVQEEYCFFLGTALKRQGLHRHVWSYWKKVFADNDDLIERMLLIDTQFESKIVVAGLKNVLPKGIVMRTLKFAYGWNATGRSKSFTHKKFDEY
jgi:hypothetical protein